MPSSKLATALKLAEDRNLRFVSLQFTDIVGQVKSVQVPMHQLEEAVEHGKWFDGSSIEGFARIAESDMFLVPDLDTFAEIPWEPGLGPDGKEQLETGSARVICDVFTPNGDPFPGDPRWVLRRQIERAKGLGFTFNTGPELEFFLLRRSNGTVEPLPHDAAGYFDLSEDLGTEVRKEMMNALAAFGIRVETAHHEVATGQHEIDFQYADALRTADNAVTFKTTLKAVAASKGLYATFMPKPFFGINGSGMHTHQSLWDVKKSRNAFSDPKDAYGLSEIARQYIAGTLEHARGMIAVLAPLVNSYKRLVPGYEAPVYVGWARINRSALIRIPQSSKGQYNSVRIELRCPDPSSNPYLAFAAMLAAGLDGVDRKLTPPDPVEENLYHFDAAKLESRRIKQLPGTLREALDELAGDEVIREALGDHIFERFLEAKTEEWDEYRKQVSSWEVERYLEAF
ncbi:MAG TPA: glutamine synthetase family protein [Candidatus Limnocylindrales bacterium]|nr:glutamine synthetase family protein [Candidatus Limnocylindrales bacterium]